jgi:hypothetical protein
MKVSEIDPDMKNSSKVLAPNADVRKKRKEDLENPDQKMKEETKMDPKGDSLLEPILTTWGSVHKETFECLWEPILTFNKVTFIYVQCQIVRYINLGRSSYIGRYLMQVGRYRLSHI